ncbi:MAG: hypothetical protein A3K18_22495 [Lentisphaerae bacterium RIFOXYA12_64_32]|nr:MAG: hypothetical protein A3K18_22495 [Lentisphaerae bacterium RIFOXYA12_64_32]
MRILLDECVPRRLMQNLPFDVATVPGIGCAGLQNGDLLRAACNGFDVFLTLDQNLQYQQNLAHFPIAILVVCAPSSRYEDILPFVPGILSALDTIKSGDLVILPR